MKTIKKKYIKSRVKFMSLCKWGVNALYLDWLFCCNYTIKDGIIINYEIKYKFSIKHVFF